MNWVIINHIYIICLANLFLKLMTVTMKNNIDFSSTNEMYLECMKKMLLSFFGSVAIYSSIEVYLLLLCILQSLGELWPYFLIIYSL